MSETKTYNPVPEGRPPVKEVKGKSVSEPSMTRKGNNDKRNGGTFLENRAKKNNATTS